MEMILIIFKRFQFGDFEMESSPLYAKETD